MHLSLSFTHRAEPTNSHLVVCLNAKTERNATKCLVGFLFVDKVPSSTGALQMVIVAKDVFGLSL